jgi:Glycosyl transferase family 2
MHRLCLQEIQNKKMPAGKLDIVVGIATSGRREVLAQNIATLAEQTRLPDRLVICPVGEEDVDESSLRGFPMPSLVVRGPVGLPAQRNKILAAVTKADIVVFFDDDFLADPRYIENLENIFIGRADVVAVTGFLIADGARGPGLTVEEGLRLIRSDTKSLGAAGELTEQYGTYGCNMAFRLEPVIAHGILFDENLPLYGWQEDIDFSLRVRPYGRIMNAAALRGVHLGIKLGRTSGVRFGYSQIANPIYLIRKGSMSWRHANKLMWRNIAANMARSFFPEPWVDRKGRLKGNLLALIDMLRGRISPGRILQL